MRAGPNSGRRFSRVSCLAEKVAVIRNNASADGNGGQEDSEGLEGPSAREEGEDYSFVWLQEHQGKTHAGSMRLQGIIVT